MHRQGEVVIQTYQSDNPLFTHLAQHDYKGLYLQQIAEREMFRYPPLHRLIIISLKHRDEHIVQPAAEQLARSLQQVFGTRCSAAVVPLVSRVQNLHIRQILLRIERTASITKAKQLLQIQIQQLRQQEKTVLISLDIDPM